MVRKIDFNFYPEYLISNFFYRTNIADCFIVAYPGKTGYSGGRKKSWKKGSGNRAVLLFICKMSVKDYFTV